MAVKIIHKNKSRMVITREETPSGMVKRIVIKAAANTVPAVKAPSKKSKAQPPEISLSQPGRLRIAHLMSLFSVSRTTLYDGVRSGRYPESDGKDGRLPYWNTETVRRWLEDAPQGAAK